MWGQPGTWGKVSGKWGVPALGVMRVLERPWEQSGHLGEAVLVDVTLRNLTYRCKACRAPRCHRRNEKPPGCPMTETATSTVGDSDGEPANICKHRE